MKNSIFLKFKGAVLLFSILLGISTIATAQSSWQYVGDYKAIVGLYDSQHFVVDNGNRDYKYTTDGGATLQNFGMSISSPKFLSYVEYLSAARMRAVVFTGRNYELHESTDGGANFTKLSDILPPGMFPLNQPPQMVSFDNSESLLSCRVLYNSQLFDVLFRTTDGGSTWNLATPDTFTFANAYDIKIYKDGQVAVASNGPQGVQISVDKGKTFTTTNSFPPLNSNMDIEFDGNQNLWVTGIIGSQNDNGYVSTDAGATWNSWTAAPNVIKAEYSKPSSILIFGSIDTTALSMDNGATFSTVHFPATKPAGSNLFIGLGSDQQTYYCIDGNAKMWTLGTGSGVGLSDWQGASPVAIYPNPANAHLYLEDYLGKVEIYNTSGQRFKSVKQLASKPLDISDLPSGIYILKLDNGFKKMVKN